MSSSRTCIICRRQLRADDSVRRGIGPQCAKNMISSVPIVLDMEYQVHSPDKRKTYTDIDKIENHDGVIAFVEIKTADSQFIDDKWIIKHIIIKGTRYIQSIEAPGLLEEKYRSCRIIIFELQGDVDGQTIKKIEQSLDELRDEYTEYTFLIRQVGGK